MQNLDNCDKTGETAQKEPLSQQTAEHTQVTLSEMGKKSSVAFEVADAIRRAYRQTC